MDLTGIGSVADLAGKVLDRVLPDQAAKDAAKFELFKAQQLGEFKLMDAQLAMAQGQMDINKVEAANASVWVSGWRPAIGWTCGAAFACKFVLGPLAVVVMSTLGHPIVLPQFDFTEMSTVLLGMLGLGGLRTYEKVQGVAK